MVISDSFPPLHFQMFVCFGSQVALEGLRPTIPPGISPHICKLMKICMNEDPAKRPKFDMIVPILEKMQDKWTPPPCPSVPEPLIPDGGVVLTSIALNSYTAASFKATIAPASETNIAVVTFIIVLFFFSFLMCWHYSSLCWCSISASLMNEYNLQTCT